MEEWRRGTLQAECRGVKAFLQSVLEAMLALPNMAQEG